MEKIERVTERVMEKISLFSSYYFLNKPSFMLARFHPCPGVSSPALHPLIRVVVGEVAMLCALRTAFALALLSPVEAFSPSLAPVRPQLLAQRNAPGVSALLVDSADAVQQAHAAVAAAPHVVPHMQGFASQLLADSGLVEGMTDEARQAASGELGWWGTYIKFVEDGILALRGFYLKQASLSLSLT